MNSSQQFIKLIITNDDDIASILLFKNLWLFNLDALLLFKLHVLIINRLPGILSRFVTANFFIPVNSFVRSYQSLHSCQFLHPFLSIPSFLPIPSSVPVNPFIPVNPCKALRTMMIQLFMWHRPTLPGIQESLPWIVTSNAVFMENPTLQSYLFWVYLGSKHLKVSKCI